jgi:AraC-like DNA-binding protein
MKKVHDIVAEFPGMVIIHQKIPGQEVGRHQHTEHEFFLPLQGEITVNYDGVEVKAGPGRMLYVPPDLDHSFTSSARGSGERVIWLIDQKTWGKHVRGKFPPSSFPMNSLAKELVFFLLIHREAKGAKFFIAALVESLFESLQSAQLEKKNVSSDHLAGRVGDSRVARAMELMEKELGAISLGEVAKRSGLSLRNFNRLFLKEAGLGPKDYLLLRRVEKAKRLLRETKLTVTDISLEVGYNSLSKFIATFKRFEGILPSDFRANRA